MASEAVKVVVRCRPLSDRELRINCKNLVETFGDTGQCSLSQPADKNGIPKCFFFDGAFGTDSTTEQIYNEVGYPLVEGVTEGYNGTIFAYGQTGCGKSFTMQGDVEDCCQRGIIPRAFDHIFETISLSRDTKFLVHVSYLEIYNEDIRDLLAKDTKARLELKEHPEKGVYVAGLSMHKVTSVQECQVLMGIGGKSRSTGATLMNADSSRSHSIFTIYLEMIDRDPDSNTEMIKAGKLNLVDLAGSERQTKTGASGDRFKEATKINLSLSALGNVISALVDAKVKHIPYRDSKLTRLLQDSLGGNTKTLMIACISPADSNYDETLSTLRYASRARNIQNRPKINEDPKDAILRQYQEEINRLRRLLEGKPEIIDVKSPSQKEEQIDSKVGQEERAQLIQDYEAKLREKEAAYKAEAADKAKLLEEMRLLRDLYETQADRTADRSFIPTRTTADSAIDTGFLSVLSEGYTSNGITTKDSLTIGDPKEGTWDMGTAEPVASVVLENDSVVPGKVGTLKWPTSVAAGMDPRRHYNLSSSLKSLSREELLRRLNRLEAGMIGGEQASNSEIRERHWRRQKYAEERRRCLEEANAALEDDGIIVGIYETIQDELFYKDKLLQREKQKNVSLKMELSDIQSEFEQDRSDYLETIRRQQRQIELLKTIIDRIQPCIRRDSNYYNLDKIKRLAKFDEEKNEWVLPQMSIERTQLPVTNMEASNRSRQTPSAPNSKESRDQSNTANHSSLFRDFESENEEEARYYAKLATRTRSTSNYFASRRASQLLSDAAALNSGHHRSSGTNDATVCPPLRVSECNIMLHHANNGGLIAGPEERHSNTKCQRKRETKTENGQSPASSPTYRGTK